MPTRSNPSASRVAEAIERLLANDWRAAHVLVQDLEDPIAWQVHGLVHRVEGDLDNARYWYERAGLTFDQARSVEDEAKALRESLKKMG
jgi:hypothetical protein